jgi:hypothetical protein
VSEEQESPAAGAAPNAQEASAGESTENTTESRISAARTDPYQDARSTPDEIAASRAYQSFQRSVSAAGPVHNVGPLGNTTVQGNFNIYTAAIAAAARTSGPVRADLIAQVVSWYAAAPEDAKLRSTLTERRLAVVRGVRRSGRSTTALKLLAEFTPGKVRRLAVESGIDESTCAQIDEGHGYLAELGPADAPADEAALDRLATRLAEQKAYCVVILPAGDSGPSLGVYLHDHIAPPRRAVFECRVEAALAEPAFAEPSNRKNLSALSRDPDLWALLGADPGPADEAWLGGLVVRIALGEVDRARALTLGVELIKGRIGEWLAALPHGIDLHRHRTAVGDFAFRLALAVLDGSPADMVAEAGERLAWDLHTTANPRLTPGRAVFTSLDEGWLAGSGACIQDGSVTVGDAPVPARLLSYRDERLPIQLLNVVWNSRPNLRGPILQWLQELSQDRRPDVWMRAALAIGLVTSWDFAYSYHEAIESWAGSDNPKQRLVAAVALEQAAHNQNTRAAVSTLLRGWARGGDATHMWTAAAAFGYGDGAADTSAVLRLLRRIGVAKDGLLAGIASDSVSELFTRGRFEEVLTAVDAWIGDTRTDEHILGLLTVLRLGDLRVRQVPSIDDLPLGIDARAALADPKRAGWPLIVAIAQYSASLGPQLIECVWQALSSTLAADTMRDEIGDWIRSAASSPELLVPLGWFLRGLIDDEDDEARLLDLVDMLAADPDEPIPLETAYAVRAAVQQSQTHLNQIAPAGR